MEQILVGPSKCTPAQWHLQSALEMHRVNMLRAIRRGQPDKAAKSATQFFHYGNRLMTKHWVNVCPLPATHQPLQPRVLKGDGGIVERR